MKAAILEAFREPLVIQTVSDPEPADHGAVLRVGANGICRSDWHCWSGHWPKLISLPHVLGHEMAGTVEAVGNSVTRLKVGDRVVVPFSGGDGSCPMCHGGHVNLCDSPVMPGFRSWGAFAEFVSVDHADLNVVPLPDQVSFLAGAGMGCRYMTAFHGIVTRAQVRPGEWVAVFGCGGVGLSAIEIATAAGAYVVGVDVDDAKLELARSIGAVAAINAGDEPRTSRAVREITKGGADVCVDALGIAATCQNAIKSLKKRGRHLQIGMTNGEDGGNLAVPLDLITDKELTLVGSKGMPPQSYPAMLRLVARGRLDPARLVTRTVRIEEAGDVLASMDDFKTLGFTVVDRF